MYDQDLAAIHEAGFTDVAEAAARMLMDLVAPCHVVDLGCGGGTALAALVDAGFTGHGIDASEAMLSIARRRVPEATFQHGDAADVPLPPCGAALATGEVLSYACTDERTLEQVFGRVHAALRGVFLFDLATPGRAREPTHVAREGKDWRVEAQAREEDGILTRTIDTWRTVDGEEHHEQEVHRLRLFEPDPVLGLLDSAGFEAERLGGYDDHGFQPGWDGFLARPTGA